MRLRGRKAEGWMRRERLQQRLQAAGKAVSAAMLAVAKRLGSWGQTEAVGAELTMGRGGGSVPHEKVYQEDATSPMCLRAIPPPPPPDYHMCRSGQRPPPGGPSSSSPAPAGSCSHWSSATQGCALPTGTCAGPRAPPWPTRPPCASKARTITATDCASAAPPRRRRCGCLAVRGPAGRWSCGALRGGRRPRGCCPAVRRCTSPCGGGTASSARERGSACGLRRSEWPGAVDAGGPTPSRPTRWPVGADRGCRLTDNRCTVRRQRCQHKVRKLRKGQATKYKYKYK